ncbi:MAG: metal-sulfur cluster assembly factor, partial [Candidatus Kapaibacterium sp.]
MDDRNGDNQADADGTAVDKDLLKERVVAQLKTVFDPELPMSVYDLGLIYEIRIDD